MYLLRQMTRVGGTFGSGPGLVVGFALFEEIGVSLFASGTGATSELVSEEPLGFFFVILRMPMLLNSIALGQKLHPGTRPDLRKRASVNSGRVGAAARCERIVQVVRKD
jgi:hypothetical protein